MLTRGVATRSALRSGFLGGNVYPRVVSPPSGLGWTPSWAVIETGPGQFTTNLQPTSLKVSTAQPRYVALTGSNANTGLSSSAPKKSIWSALGVGGNDTIYILGSTDPSNPTVYNDDNSWGGVPVQACNVIVVSSFTTLAPGYALSSTYTPPGGARMGTWGLTADPDGPNVYEATLAAAPGSVIDHANLTNGLPTKLTSRASVALVEANPGSYYHSGTSLFVRTSDSRAPDSSLRPLRSATHGQLNTAISLYVERLSFEGGSRAFYVQNGATVTLVDCTFSNAELQGCDLSAAVGVTNATINLNLIRCTTRGNAGDGFGYTALGSGMTVRGFEWDCAAYRNSGAGTDQGSSAHFTAGNTAVTIARVGCTTYSNKTQGVADVGGCLVWEAGCRHTSETTGVYCGDTGTTWLDGCVLSGNTTDLVTDDAGGTIYVHGTIYATTSGAGSVTAY